MPDNELRRPRHCSEPELSKVAVEIVDRHSMWFECKVCGEIWSPNLGAGGRLPRGYWRCPTGCNSN